MSTDTETDRSSNAASSQVGGSPWAMLIAAVALSSVAAIVISTNMRPADTSPTAPSTSTVTDGTPSGPTAVPASLPVTAPRIAADPTAVGTPTGARAATTLDIKMITVELQGQLADGTAYDYWTFDSQVPGPMLRARVGDTINLTLDNDASSTNIHSVDLHAVNGPGGGAMALQVPPGESSSISFQALNPGVYVYHCATPHIPTHIANGMYGLIVIEPEGGLTPVDREFYVMQGEIYSAGDRGAPGLAAYDFPSMLDERPNHVVFNGSVNALTGDDAMQAAAGETVRLFVGNGGPNLTSSFHVIGEIFDTVHPEGAREALHDVQTTSIPAGGATWVEFKVDVPGTYLLVDHAITRTIDKGALAILNVTGENDPAIFDGAAPEPAPAPPTPVVTTFSPGDEIVVSMTEFAFAPGDLQLEAGEYTFVVTNDGVAPHQFALGKLGVHTGHDMDTGNLSPGESMTMTMQLEAGSYEVGCHIPGHFEAGMHTTITVS